MPPAVLKWRVQWGDLLALEPRISGSGPSSRQPAGPDRLVVHRKGRPGMDGEPALSEQLRTYSTVPQVGRDSFSSEVHAPKLSPARSASPALVLAVRYGYAETGSAQQVSSQHYSRQENLIQFVARVSPHWLCWLPAVALSCCTRR